MCLYQIHDAKHVPWDADQARLFQVHSHQNESALTAQSSTSLVKKWLAAFARHNLSKTDGCGQLFSSYSHNPIYRTRDSENPSHTAYLPGMPSKGHCLSFPPKANGCDSSRERISTGLCQVWTIEMNAHRSAYLPGIPSKGDSRYSPQEPRPPHAGGRVAVCASRQLQVSCRPAKKKENALKKKMLQVGRIIPATFGFAGIA